MEFVNIDCIGMGSTRYLGWEVPVIGRSLSYPREVLAIAGQVSREQDITDAGPHSVPGPTDGLAFLTRGIGGITIAGFGDGGKFPNYHQMTDTANNVDFESAYRIEWMLPN